jgi:serine/threonine-protein phosphatase 2A regulatory subunit B''
MEPCDITERFFRVVKQRKARAIEPADLMPFLEELLAYHPGLAFWENTSEFQEKYARTVIARVFFACDPTAKQVVDLRALRNSNVVAAFALVDIEEDINQVHNYFSYEHFYVLYCKFWELDTDHDFQLTRSDLSKMHSLTPCVLDRVMARAGRPFTAARDKNHMGYEDFCIFFMASEDKTTPQVSYPSLL